MQQRGSTETAVGSHALKCSSPALVGQINADAAQTVAISNFTRFMKGRVTSGILLTMCTSWEDNLHTSGPSDPTQKGHVRENAHA
jgi:hypothetical protein